MQYYFVAWAEGFDKPLQQLVLKLFRKKTLFEL